MCIHKTLVIGIAALGVLAVGGRAQAIKQKDAIKRASLPAVQASLRGAAPDAARFVLGSSAVEGGTYVFPATREGRLSISTGHPSPGRTGRPRKGC